MVWIGLQRFQSVLKATKIVPAIKFFEIVDGKIQFKYFTNW